MRRLELGCCNSIDIQLRLQHRRTKNSYLPVAALLQPMAGKIKKDAE
jgi:hypothetical protein